MAQKNARRAGWLISLTLVLTVGVLVFGPSLAWADELPNEDVTSVTEGVDQSLATDDQQSTPVVADSGDALASDTYTGKGTDTNTNTDTDQIVDASTAVTKEDGEVQNSSGELTSDEPLTDEETLPEDSQALTGDESTSTDAQAADSEALDAQATATTLDGVDISGWNTGIDYTKLGDFVIIKATEYNPSKGTYTSYNDYNTQASRALAEGKLIGFYHFASSYSYSHQTYEQQAQGFIDAIAPYLGQALLFLDWEDSSYSTVESDVAGAKRWLDYVYEKTGVRPLIYMNKNCTNAYNWSSVVNAGYELWGAQYLNKYYYHYSSYKNNTTGFVDDPELTSGWGAWGTPIIYQYSSTAVLHGDKDYDVNIFYGTKADWESRAKGNTWMECNGDYYYLRNGVMLNSSWVVTALSPTGANYGAQRYWIDATGKLAVDRLITSSEAGYYAYARPEGYVVRGKYITKNGYIYLANNDGRLESVGWRVSGSYGDGTQRYYIDADAHAAIVGYSSDGWGHYTRPEGYVVRGKYIAKNGYVYLANNDGKLETPGWHVSNSYGDGTQRYYVDAEAHACVPGFSPDGWDHYTRPEGYVVRGSYTINGSLYVANNDGKLALGSGLKNGWLVTSSFGQGTQRYWVEDGTVVFGRLIQVNETTWAYARPEGYVVRGKYTASNGCVYLANNDGKLEAPGWHVSGSYGDGTQRYYVDSEAHACVPGFSPDGWDHYTTSKGYVLRGTTTEGGVFRSANNDGKLNDGWIVTNAFGQGTQRYWQQNGEVVRDLLVQTAENSWAYARPEGYVVRGKYTAKNGYVYLANNDGKLEAPGWHVSGSYGDGTQRYYVDSEAHACVPGFSPDGWDHYTTSKGYVLRNANYLHGGAQYKADNEGKLSYVTDASTAIINAAKATVASSTGRGFEWVIDVLTAAGFYEVKDCDPHTCWAYSAYGASTSTSDLRVGMVVMVPSTTAAASGLSYGHAALYIGDGKVMHCDGTVETMTLDAWKAEYATSSMAKWGWLLDAELV